MFSLYSSKNVPMYDAHQTVGKQVKRMEIHGHLGLEVTSSQTHTPSGLTLMQACRKMYLDGQLLPNDHSVFHKKMAEIDVTELGVTDMTV